MKKYAIIFVAIVAVGFGGCAALLGMPSRSTQLAWLAKHPDLPPGDRAEILQHKISRGMTKAEVLISMGAPCGFCSGDTQNSWGDTWDYTLTGDPGYGTVVYFGPDGTVVGWGTD